VQIFISIISDLKVMWDPILHEHYLHRMLPYSKFCEDGLMMVKLLKHIVIKEKNKKIYCCVDWNQYTILLSLSKNQFPETGNKGASIAYSL